MISLPTLSPPSDTEYRARCTHEHCHHDHYYDDGDQDDDGDGEEYNEDDDDAPIKTFTVAEQMYARAALSLSSHSEQQLRRN